MSPLPGWKKLVNKFIPNHTAPFTIKNGDSLFSGDISSYIDREIYLFGGYEKASIQAFLSSIPKGRNGTILDIGANVGNHSLAFSRVFNTVYSCEPNPLLWEQFERNVQLNRLKNVFLHKVGLADRDDELTLHMIDKPNFGLGTFSTVEQYDLPLKAIVKCSIWHASTYLSRIGVEKVDAIKIDVQGFEPEVLRGLAEVLQRDKPIIWCEIGAGTLTSLDAFDDLIRLIPFEFLCFKFNTKSFFCQDVLTLVNFSGEMSNADYLIIPK
jgi:FkbM family methyltransferase